jgi:hypothetical protein
MKSFCAMTHLRQISRAVWSTPWYAEDGARVVIW